MQSKHLTVRRPLLRSKHNVDYDAGGRGGGGVQDMVLQLCTVKKNSFFIVFVESIRVTSCAIFTSLSIIVDILTYRNFLMTQSVTMIEHRNMTIDSHEIPPCTCFHISYLLVQNQPTENLFIKCCFSMFVCFCLRSSLSTNPKASDLADSFINRAFRVGLDLYESNFLTSVISCTFFLWPSEAYLHFSTKIIQLHGKEGTPYRFFWRLCDRAAFTADFSELQ